MKNIERFNIYTAQIFAMLYVDFPVPRTMRTVDILHLVEHTLDLSQEERSKQPHFIGFTLKWLEDTEYLRAFGEGSGRTFVLAPKAFEAMNAPLPKSLRQRDEAPKSIGEKMTEFTHQLGADLAVESRKQVAAKLVGEVIGYAMRSFSGPP